MAEKTSFKGCKLCLADLRQALHHNEKLGKLPETVETDTIYRLALASNAKGELQFYQCSFNNK